MLFYTNKESELGMIPSGYHVIVISRNIKVINHPNAKRIKELLPEMDINDDKKKELRQKYRKSLNKELKEYIVPLVQVISKSESANSVVFVCNKQDTEDCGFNYVKAICNYIEKRYEYTAFEFTNCVTKTMRDLSKCSKKGNEKLISDIIKINNEERYY